MIWLKAIHIAAIAIWSAGLVCLPSLYVQRSGVPHGPTLHRLQGTARFMYVGILSPAAFVAVGTGIALIFLRTTFEGWFTLKLFLVGMMVVLHVFTGLVIIRLFDKGETYGLKRFIGVTAVTVGVVCAILAVVLAKPDLPQALPNEFFAPGALAELLGGFNPFRR